MAGTYAQQLRSLGPSPCACEPSGRRCLCCPCSSPRSLAGRRPWSPASPAALSSASCTTQKTSFKGALAWHFWSLVFFMNQLYPGPRLPPQNSSFVCFREVIHEKGFFQRNLQIKIPGDRTISGYRIVTQRFINFRVMIFNSWQFPDIVTQKMTQHFCLLGNLRVLWPGSWKLFNFRYCYLKIDKFWVSLLGNLSCPPCNNTRKFSFRDQNKKFFIFKQQKTLKLHIQYLCTYIGL